MADKKISQLPVKGLPVSDNDLFEVSVFNGVDYDTFSVSGADVKAGLPATNVYNSDGTLSGNRNVDANGYQLQISNAGVFIVDSSFAPSGGNGTFTLNGYGTTSTDRVEKITSDSGVLRESFGDKSVQHYGSNGFNTTPNGLGWVMVDSAGAGVSGVYVSGTTTVGVRADVSNASCFVGNGQIGVNVNGSLYGVYTRSSAGTSIFSQGKVYLESNGVNLGPVENSALVEMNSTTQGALLPRLTTTERDAIPSPAVGLEIYNRTLGRKEVYNATFGWVGMAERTIHVEANTLASLSTGSNFYFGNMPVTSSTTIANRQFKSPYNGKITGASIRSHAVSVAGDRTITVSIRINDTTDYLVQAVTSTSANREFINFALNTNGIPITTSDNIAIKVVASGGTTDSTNILFGGTLIVQ